MLVIARKRDQRIKIGEDIDLVVISVRDGVVRLGIDAPKDVRIKRGEVADVKQDEAVCRD